MPIYICSEQRDHVASMLHGVTGNQREQTENSEKHAQQGATRISRHSLLRL